MARTGGKRPYKEKPKNQSSVLYPSCSLLMGSLFAYSASVQLDDPDWYFWLPLYATASAVNLLNVKLTSNIINRVARLVVCVGLFLFVRVLVEGCRVHGMGGLWSLDMEERVVREKLGSGLVVISMFLQLQASDMSQTPNRRSRGVSASSCVVYGMAAQVAVAFGLTFWFFVFIKDIRL